MVSVCGCVMIYKAVQFIKICFARQPATDREVVTWTFVYPTDPTARFPDFVQSLPQRAKLTKMQILDRFGRMN